MNDNLEGGKNQQSLKVVTSSEALSQSLTPSLQKISWISIWKENNKASEWK